MLAPGDGSDHVQVIDARDVARFAVRSVKASLSGVFNLAGPRLTWADFMGVLGAQHFVWASADILTAANLNFQKLPLYRPENGPRSSLRNVSNEKALIIGLTLTDPTTTIDDTRAWGQERMTPPVLEPEGEVELIRMARSSQMN